MGGRERKSGEGNSDLNEGDNAFKPTIQPAHFGTRKPCVDCFQSHPAPGADGVGVNFRLHFSNAHGGRETAMCVTPSSRKPIIRKG